MEVAVLVDEGPENWEVNVRGHIVPEERSLGNAISSCSREFRPLNVIGNGRIAEDEGECDKDLETNNYHKSHKQL